MKHLRTHPGEEQPYTARQQDLAKACRKNYTLQNPGFLQESDFRGFGGKFPPLGAAGGPGGPCNFNRGAA